MANLTKLYKDDGKEWQGTLRSLAKECSKFSEKSWEVLSTKYVMNPKTNRQEVAYELGKLVREVHYKSEYENGVKIPYVSVTYVWSNGKQTYPRIDKSEE